jgi:hypothetical protein
MQNEINIKVKNGYWTINDKPINKCSAPKKKLFDSFVKMKLVKQKLDPNELQGLKENKLSFNYKFRAKLERITNDYLHNIQEVQKITFTRKN